MSLLLLLACADEVRDVTVTGTDGLPELTWAGADAESITFAAVDGTFLWNLIPEGELCVNSLQGRDGVFWGELPEGYISLDAAGAPLPAPESLEDGSYSVGVGLCTEPLEVGAAYVNKGASFVITNGVIEQLVSE